MPQRITFWIALIAEVFCAESSGSDKVLRVFIVQGLFDNFTCVKVDTKYCSDISVIHYCASSPIRSLY